MLSCPTASTTLTSKAANIMQPQQQQQQQQDHPHPASSPTPSLDSLTKDFNLLSSAGSSNPNSSNTSTNGDVTSVESGLGASTAAAAATSSSIAAALASSSSASSSGLGSSPSQQLIGLIGSSSASSAVSSSTTLANGSNNNNELSFSSMMDSMSLEFSSSSLTNGIKEEHALPQFESAFTSSGLTQTTAASSTASSSSNNNNNNHEQQQRQELQMIIQEGKGKIGDFTNSAKKLEQLNNALRHHLIKCQSEVNQSYQFFLTLLEEQRQESLSQLEAAFTAKHQLIGAAMGKAITGAEKTQEIINQVNQLSRSHPHSEVLAYRAHIEASFASVYAANRDCQLPLGEEQLLDFAFAAPVSLSAAQSAVKSAFGYVRTRSDSGNSTNSSSSAAAAAAQSTSGPTSLAGLVSGSAALSNGGLKQPPISRPSSGTSLGFNGLAAGILAGGGLGEPATSSLLDSGSRPASGSSSSNGLPSSTSSSAGYHLPSSLALSPDPSDSGSLMAKRFGRSNSGLGPLVGNGELSSNHSLLSHSSNGRSGHSHLASTVSNPYERWSNGGESLLSSGAGSGKLFDSAMAVQAAVAAVQQQQLNGTSSNGSTSNGHNSLLPSLSSPLDSLDHFGHHAHLTGTVSNPLSSASKLLAGGLLSHQSASSTASSSAASGFPPKSQIKRQKMIYHCKFGEFGVLEGQFTEPSGVAVNAQNDIIVADTNNHRIQIFDKEGRFKFQFGECGKRDGQLLYPNRVAVVRQSGDIIVTERSPTHQVQIYNQYGQFVRKFGANILQHPRGVCVDNKGRIIVVECKVMRVIIFDQTGNVLNKFGCSKHLEFPNGVVVNDRQEIFISDNRAHCVKVFNYEGAYLRQIGGEGLTNYPIGVGINLNGEVTIADNHNNFNLSVFNQDGQLLSALESKVKHAQCFDVALMDDGSVVLASKDYRLYIYRYVQVPPLGL